MFQAVSLILAAATLDLGTLFSDPEAWKVQSEMFAVEHAQAGFQFASEDRDIVNSLNHDTCTWNGLQVWETKVFFDKSGEEEKVIRVELSLYNRGDAEKGGSALDVAQLKEKITAVTKVLAPNEKNPVDEKTTLKNDALQFRREFAKSDPAAELVWGLSSKSKLGGGRAVEYLRLTLMPRGVKTSKGGGKSAAGKAQIKDNVTKSPNGDVYIDGVPMVDQGQKGYCAAAVAERVLRYYGLHIDEHEIAQQADTSAENGTSVAVMIKTITAIGEKNGLGYQGLVSMSGSIADLEDEVARYNKAAKAMKKPELSLAQFTSDNVIYISEMRAAMDKMVIFKMRQKDARFKKFSAGIRQQVAAGIPVFWGVTLGIFPERGVNPQSTGGHMRLIIGYNDKKKEILFTDTWGEGHELKRMPEAWAFAITHDAFFLKPR